MDSTKSEGMDGKWAALFHWIPVAFKHCLMNSSLTYCRELPFYGAPSFLIALGHHELHSAHPVTTVAPLGTLSGSFAKSRSINFPLGPPSVAESVIMTLFSDILAKYLPIFKHDLWAAVTSHNVSKSSLTEVSFWHLLRRLLSPSCSI
jgi:hypothetical protein